MTTRRTLLRNSGFIALATGCTEFKKAVAYFTSDPKWNDFPQGILSSGRLIQASSANYDEARTVTNPRIDVSPGAIAKCQNTEEVAQVVRWARSKNQKFSIRSGGHSYEGYSMSDGLVIDVSRIKNFSLNETTMTVGAGWKQGELAERLWQERPNTAAVMGSCKTVGLSGFALGGGFGFLSRLHGMGVDNIVSLKMVDAKGDVYLADSSQNADLFWALRGGGCGNFGIVTEIEYKVHNVPSKVTTFFKKFPLEKASTLIPLWFQWIQSMDPRIVSILSINGGAGNKSVNISGQFLGAPAELLSLPAPNWGESMDTWVKERSFLDAVDYFNGGKETQRESRWRARSDYFLKPLNQAGIEAISEIVSQQGNPWGYAFIFDAYGPNITSVPKESMAFAHRENILCCMQLYMSWGGTKRGPNAQDSNSVIRMKSMGKALEQTGNVSGQAYPNYIDATRDDWQTAYYGTNLDRLKQLKAKYDPQNIFNFPQSIPLS